MSENNKKSIDIKAFAKKNKIALICVGAVALIGILAIIIKRHSISAGKGTFSL